MYANKKCFPSPLSDCDALTSPNESTASMIFAHISIRSRLPSIILFKSMGWSKCKSVEQLENDDTYSCSRFHHFEWFHSVACYISISWAIAQRTMFKCDIDFHEIWLCEKNTRFSNICKYFQATVFISHTSNRCKYKNKTK